ncbi:hypothetical protein D3C80_1323920 [compost metagenome]
MRHQAASKLQILLAIACPLRMTYPQVTCVILIIGAQILAAAIALALTGAGVVAQAIVVKQRTADAYPPAVGPIVSQRMIIVQLHTWCAERVQRQGDRKPQLCLFFAIRGAVIFRIQRNVYLTQAGAEAHLDAGFASLITPSGLSSQRQVKAV